MIIQSAKFPHRSHFYAASSEMMQPILWRKEVCVPGFVNVYRSLGRQYSQSTSYIYPSREEADNVVGPRREVLYRIHTKEVRRRE